MLFRSVQEQNQIWLAPARIILIEFSTVHNRDVLLKKCNLIFYLCEDDPSEIVYAFGQRTIVLERHCIERNLRIMYDGIHYELATNTCIRRSKL